MRDHIKKAPPRKGRSGLNEAIDEVFVTVRSAIAENRVAVENCRLEPSKARQVTSWSQCTIHGAALIRKISSESSNRFTPQRPPASEWVCRSADPSSTAMGGRLWVAPDEPRGAVFQFTLPVAQEDS